MIGRPVTAAAVPATLTTWAEHRLALDRTGGQRTAQPDVRRSARWAATGLALLAVGFAVIAEARTRGRVLSRLRTMGLSGRQGRRLLVYELVPLVGAAVLAGGLVGVVLPGLLGPALEPVHLHRRGGRPDPPRSAAGGRGAGCWWWSGLAAALAIENLVNRRMRLGEVLRLGEEN